MATADDDRMMDRGQDVLRAMMEQTGGLSRAARDALTVDVDTWRRTDAAGHRAWAAAGSTAAGSPYSVADWMREGYQLGLRVADAVQAATGFRPTWDSEVFTFVIAESDGAQRAANAAKLADRKARTRLVAGACVGASAFAALAGWAALKLYERHTAG